MISQPFCVARYPHRVIASIESTYLNKRVVAVMVPRDSVAQSLSLIRGISIAASSLPMSSIESTVTTLNFSQAFSSGLVWLERRLY